MLVWGIAENGGCLVLVSYRPPTIPWTARERHFFPHVLTSFFDAGCIYNHRQLHQQFFRCRWHDNVAAEALKRG